MDKLVEMEYGPRRASDIAADGFGGRWLEKVIARATRGESTRVGAKHQGDGVQKVGAILWKLPGKRGFVTGLSEQNGVFKIRPAGFVVSWRLALVGAG